MIRSHARCVTHHKSRFGDAVRDLSRYLIKQNIRKCGKSRKSGDAGLSRTSHPTRFGNRLCFSSRGEPSFRSSPFFDSENRFKPSASHVFDKCARTVSSRNSIRDRHDSPRLIASLSPVEPERCSKTLNPRTRVFTETRFGLDPFSTETPPVQEPEGVVASPAWVQMAPLRLFSFSVSTSSFSGFRRHAPIHNSFPLTT